MIKSVVQVAGLLLLCGALGACSQSGEEAVQEAENDVFAIHDKVMPFMDDVMSLRKQLKGRMATLDSTKASGSATETVRIDEEREQAKRLIRDLTIADSLMSDWMANYKNDTIAKLSSDDALRYLEQQKESITDVQHKLTTSIKDAKQFLEKP
ncbi:hypothetical protein GCM10028806_31820 [Spirosoma terrae]|uniref:Viral A-type inclusion protein n=1 Tax=Spirosoma terrae TaxID=1968276 RepID=A0A6L9L4J7_9BACT|nr:viral A-type inclusion protein [Spirosoma terrae]NDU95496.1 viral A-type inclusion protein [Spirosoma terrae]